MLANPLLRKQWCRCLIVVWLSGKEAKPHQSPLIPAHGPISGPVMASSVLGLVRVVRVEVCLCAWTHSELGK